MKTLLYVGSNQKFAEKINENLTKEIEIEFLNSESFNLLDFEVEILTKINSIIATQQEDFLGFIIQVETRFMDNKSLSDCSGLELLKHILLTESIGDFRQSKFICLSFFPQHYHINRNPDNAILFAPEVTLLDIVLQPETMAKKIANELSIYNREVKDELVFEKSLNNYIIWTDHDQDKYKHDGRNYAGILRLYREYYFDEPSMFNKQIVMLSEDSSFKKDIMQLGLKKIIFKHKIKISYDKPDNSKYDKVKSLKFNALIVDDKSYWLEFFKTILDTDITTDSVFNSIYNEYDEPKLNITINTLNEAEIEFTPIEYVYDIFFIDLYKKEMKDGKDENYQKGMELLKNIRLFDKFTPVIMFTASEDPKIIKEVFLNECTDYFMKDRDLLSKLFDSINNNVSESKINNLKRFRNLYYFLSVMNDFNSFKYKLPQLTKKKDISITYTEPKEVIYLNELSIEKRLMAMALVEKIIDSTDSDTDINELYKIFISDDTALDKSFEGCFLQILLNDIRKIFNNNPDKKIYSFDNKIEVIDNTLNLFESFKPVQGIITRINDHSITIKISNINNEYEVIEETLTKLGLKFNSLKHNQSLIVYKNRETNPEVLIKLK